MTHPASRLKPHNCRAASPVVATLHTGAEFTGLDLAAVAFEPVAARTMALAVQSARAHKCVWIGHGNNVKIAGLFSSSSRMRLQAYH